jgi:hypothetical protein
MRQGFSVPTVPPQDDPVLYIKDESATPAIIPIPIDPEGNTAAYVLSLK